MFVPKEGLKLVEMIDELDFVGIQPTRKYKYYTIYGGEIGSYSRATN